MAENYLYCTDEHRFRSPLCTAHDLGITPAQIVLNAIERYDSLYDVRNRRSYRKFWDTTGYAGQVYNAIFPLQRMWNLAAFDWGGGGIQATLKRMDQLQGTVRTDPEYDEIAIDYFNDVSAAMDLQTAFYGAVLSQPAAYRNYQTEFDPYYGDVLRMGIILDKLFATFAFMDLQEIYNYNPNVYTYAALYDAPFDSRQAALTQRVLDDMLGRELRHVRLVPVLRAEHLRGGHQHQPGGLRPVEGAHRDPPLRQQGGPRGGVRRRGARAGAPCRQPGPDLHARRDSSTSTRTLADRGWHLVSGQVAQPGELPVHQGVQRGVERERQRHRGHRTV